MIISQGPTRPLLVSLAFGCCRCCCPVLLCCLLMLVWSLPAASVLANPEASSLASPPAANGNYKLNLTELTEDGRRIQVVTNEHIQGGSLLYQQVEYLVPPPGPRALIQVNFTRIIQSGSSIPHLDSTVNDSLHTSSNNETSTYGDEGISVLEARRQSEQQLKASPVESSGSRRLGSTNRGWDMLAVGNTGRQHLHQTEGDQLKHKQPVATATSRTSAASITATRKKARLSKSSASAILLNKSRTQWPGSKKVENTALDTSPANISGVTKLFPPSGKPALSQHSPISSSFNNVSEDKYHLPYSSFNKEKPVSDIWDEREDTGPSRARAAENVTPVTPRPSKRNTTLRHTGNNTAQADGSPQIAIGSGNESKTIGTTSNSSGSNNPHLHSKRLSQQTSVRTSGVTSTSPVPEEGALTFLFTTKSFSPRDSADHLSPILGLSKPHREQTLERSLNTAASDHTDYLQPVTSVTDPLLTQDCSLKVIIEETESSVHRGLGLQSKRSTQPQVICWQAGWDNEGRSPLVYRYTTPIRITYLWADKQHSGLALKFSFPSLDEIECHFQCSTTPHLCLVSQQLCDGYTDCPDHSDELPKACHSSQDRGQNEALLPDRPPPYSQLHQEQQQQQHQQLLTYTGAGVVSSLQPAQNPPAQHRQYLLPQLQQQQQQYQQQQKQQHHLQYQQLQYPNNNISSHNINNNDLPGAVSFQQQQVYQLPQQQQHMLLQHPLPSPDSNTRDRVEVQRPPPSSFSDNSSTNTSPHEGDGRFQHHLYNNPLSNNDDGDSRGNNAGSYLNQYTHNLHHQQHQKNQRQAKHPQSVTHPQNIPGFSTMSVLPPQQQQCPPHIPVSLDGEEGYLAAQRSLHSKRQVEQNLEAEFGIFRAPPNRSALERDSPPPPYSVQPPSTTSFSLDSLLSGSYFSSSCPTSFTGSSSQSPVSSRGGRGRGGGRHSQDSSSAHSCASTASTNRH
ncbi:hypothetical protein ElyMa_002418000 [Elysia marginata]|uniref:ZP domain-containing protein n=1 Tax=Elysia marginata TaxID=1093978 RepID=A0AAV4GG21_9GAST|nr:hypothetical protein ElyMa_002418000 [Elysia marginata]